MPATTLEDEFWARVDRGRPSECWLWRGPRQKGYGYFKFAGTRYRAHRLSWEIASGRSIPGKLIVRHRCDVPACVNPAHLLLGTHAENVADRVRRGRSRYVAGEQHGSAKLTGDQVREMRAAYAAGDVRQEDLGRRFGVTQPTVSYIVNGRGWK